MSNIFGGDTGVDADFETSKNEIVIIYIDGYWLDNGEKFEGYKCAIGEYDEDDEYCQEIDEDIFYWFDAEEDVDLMKNFQNRTDTEFVITKVVKEREV
jgi:hypothetical protein